MTNVVLVTGGGRGIGAASAKLLASKGYLVAVNYRDDKASADQVVGAIQEKGGTALAFQADVSDEQQVVLLFDQIESSLGPVTHLVNNAGRLMTQARFADISLERFNTILNANLTSCFLCCREYLRRQSKSGLKGAIVNVSSVAARTGSPFEYIDYAASKGGMDALTRGLATELADTGIRVNGVRPGFIYTDMHADGGEPGRVDRLAPVIPMKRGGTSDEVAQSIAWLLSDDASYVTGSFIDVAGGR